MRKFKKLLSVLLVAALLLSVAGIGTSTLTVSAATSGYYTYEVVNGEVKIIMVDESISGNIKIPSKLGGYPVTDIGDWAFCDSDSLTGITIPNGVTNIGAWAFSDCAKLKNVTISNGVISIEQWAFSNCPKITSIVIPDSVKSIDTGAFSKCTRLKNIVIPDSVTDISYDVFYNTAYYNDASNWKNKVLYIDNHLIEAKENISGKYKVKAGTKTIAAMAFYECENLKGITFPNSVTAIGGSSFDSCCELKSITIPDSVTDIGGGAFYNTAYYNNASNWKNKVLYIGNHLIEAKEDISGEYKVRAGTKTIADSAFGECNILNSVIISDSVTHIGEQLFGYCNRLTSVTIGKGVKYISDYAFRNCNRLETITVNKANKYYSSKGGVLFNKKATVLILYPQNKQNKTYTMSNSVTSIGGSAFRGCQNLKNIKIGNSVKKIGEFAFSRCVNLTNVTIPDSVIRIEMGMFYECNKITDIWYMGSKTKKSKILINSTYNEELLSVTWHYNSCNRKTTHTYKTTTTKATTTKNGSIIKKCADCGKVASKKTIRYAKKFTLSTTNYPYAGKVRTPNVVVKDSAGNKLKKGTDYTVTYPSGRKNVGSYKVTVKMKGNYSGTKTLTFKITPKKTTVSKLTAGNNSIKVAITKKSTQVTGYQIQYSTSKKFTNAKLKNISSYKTTKYTLKGLKDKKTYFVRVRTYKTVNGKRYYSGWSTIKYVKTK